jgi:hypothetical protein
MEYSNSNNSSETMTRAGQEVKKEKKKREPNKVMLCKFKHSFINIHPPELQFL